MAHAYIDIHTEHDLADIEICNKLGEVLEKHYPGHPWMVGCNHTAGTAHIELCYPTRVIRMFPYGMLLHISKLKNHDHLVKKAIWAGGELLERYGLKRGKANRHAASDVKRTGIDLAGEIR